MNATEAAQLRHLLESQQLAALATIHKGEPAVSMVPYALLPDGEGLVIHISRLATHTADIERQPSVALLVMAPPDSAPLPQAVQRASLQGSALPCGAGAPAHQRARAAYLARFPQSEELFAFGDFSLFVIAVRAVRFVAGFGAARSILAAEYTAILSGPSLAPPPH